MNPTITIIIPHHNIPNLLERCLLSIPDIPDIEVIIVDDNSNSDIVDFDNFPGIKRKHTRVFFTKESKGAGYARNVGLKYARGNWIVFADADDYFAEDAMSILKSYNNCDAEMVVFKALSVDSDTLIPSNRNERINNLIDAFYNNELSSRNVSLSVQVPWCRMIKRTIIEEKNILFDEVMASNDTMFTTKVSCLAKNIVISDKVLYIVTFRLGSLWNERFNNPKNYLTRLEVQIRRNDYIEKFGFRKNPILGTVIKALNIDFITFLRAIKIAIKYNALFDGFSLYIFPFIKKK